MAKKCPPGKYYCFTDKKCKKIPRGYHIGARGYLARDTKDDDSETKKNGNGSSNGNGNGGNGAGNGNGGSGGNGGGNGGGGMGESIVYEASNPRIPRKKGQPAKSKKHSDLYTDEDPKGTIHGLGFKDVAKAKASVSKIRNSSRSHAHKIQAAVAMEQRAREMGKTSEAAVYRKYINAMKKKTKRMNEAANPAQQAAIAIDMKKKGKKPKSMKEGMYNHTDVGLITNAVVELEDGLKTLKSITYDSVDQLMQGIAKRNDITPTLLHNQFKAKHFTIPDDWAIRYRMNKMKGIEEATMTSAQKRKDTMLKKKYDKSDMKKSMQKQYGKEEGKKVYFATIRKQAMSEMNNKEMLDKMGVKLNSKGMPDLEAAADNPEAQKAKNNPEVKDAEKKIGDAIQKGMSKIKIKEESQDGMLARVRKAQNKLQNKEMGIKSSKPIEKPKLKKPENKFTNDEPKPENKFSTESLDDKYNVSEEGLRDWFGKSSGTTKSGRKVRGWVQVGGKYDGKPCARQPGQKSTPKCVSSSKRRSMSKSERDSAARRKRAADPNQPQKSGAAKPTNVSTDPKKKMKESFVNEAKDKKGKGSGTKDACYHKVKSRYSVWPSAYASGALVKCRKVGAANWGNKSKNEGFSPMQVAALEAAGMVEIKEGQKCWKGYEKKGTKMMFGKRYNNCVKKKATKEEVEIQEMGNPSMDINPDKFKKVQKQAKIRKVAENPGTKGEGQAAKNVIKDKTELPKLESYAPVTEGVMELIRAKKEEKKKSKPSVSKYVSQRDAGKLAKKAMSKKDQEKVNFLEPEETNESKTRLVKNGHTYKVILTWRGKTYMVQMFVPSVSRPTRQQVEKEVQKIYPDAKLMSFLPKDLEPGEPTVMMGEEKHERDEYGDMVGGPKISKKQKAKNLAKNEKDEDHTTTTSEETISEISPANPTRIKQPNPYSIGNKLKMVIKGIAEKERSKAGVTKEETISEDDMKGMSVKSGHKRPTKSGAGMTAKGVAAYRRRNPGSKLKTAVTGKVKKGSKDAKRRKSYCARSAGQMKKFPKAAKDPNSRLRQARRRWKC